MKQDERDMLISVVTKVEGIAEQQSHMDGKLDKHIEKDDTFLTKKMWMWVTGFIMTIILGAFTYTYNVSDDSHKHQTNMYIHHMENDHNDATME
ncbi:MAG: hypothetical protein ACXABF_10935 [Candidatus Thorarchaeota archaeon]|jgi:preprotein translocase subunit SecG